MKKLLAYFPPACFDIMIYFILNLPKGTILGRPVYMRRMYPFERYIKKLKEYVWNKACPEGFIAKGYIVDEDLTFCSMYLGCVETKFNWSERNSDVDQQRRT